MKLLLILFFNILNFSIFASEVNVLSSDSVELVNALQDNIKVLRTFSQSSEKVSVYKITVEHKSDFITEFNLLADKIVQGDILQGQVTLKIKRKLFSQNPENFYYVYDTEIIDDSNNTNNTEEE